MPTPPLFSRYIGIDYSGAKTPVSSLKGLRIYSATPSQPPAEVLPPPGPRKYWTRRGIGEWLVTELREGPPTLVGMDHAFSFPLRYFQEHRVPRNWKAFLDDFRVHWPTDQDRISIDLIRHGIHRRGKSRTGNARWRRLCDERAGAKSVFHFDVPGSVAKSTHAGLPWLLHLRKELGDRIHFWPFDGWTPSSGVSVLAEIYPSLWNRTFPPEDRTGDQHDAYSVARWMKETDAADALGAHFQPQLTPGERTRCQLEGWILGLT